MTERREEDVLGAIGVLRRLGFHTGGMLLRQKRFALALDYFSLADVADVALVDLVAVLGVAVADKLHGDFVAFAILQGQVLKADFALVLQLAHGDFVGLDILEHANLPK